METQGHEIRVIRDVLLRTPSEKIRALKHVPLKNTITNKFQNKNRRFPMKKTAVYGWENGGLYVYLQKIEQL